MLDNANRVSQGQPSRETHKRRARVVKPAEAEAKPSETDQVSLVDLAMQDRLVEAEIAIARDVEEFIDDFGGAPYSGVDW